MTGAGGSRPYRRTMRRLLGLACLTIGLVAPSAAATPVLTGHLFWQTTDAQLHVARADGRGGTVVRLPSHIALDSLTVDRNRSKIAFVLLRTSASPPELWVADAAGRAPHQVKGPVYPSDPSWSPDGRRLVYVSALASLHVIGADGSGDRPVTAVAGVIDDPEWSPRGDSVVYAHNLGVLGVGGVALEVIGVDALVPTPRVLVPLVDRTLNPRWAPDGRSVSYLVPDGLYVVDSVSAVTRRLAAGGDPSYAGGAPWSPDGRALLLCRPRAGLVAGLGGGPLKEIDARSGRERQIGRTACLTPAWSPDGRHTAVVDLSRADRTHLVVRDRRGGVVRDLGQAWGVGVAWTRL